MKNFFPPEVYDDRPDDYSPRELMIGGGLIDKNGKVNVPLYNQWLYRGVFSATSEANGPGTSSSYSFPDIMVVAIIVLLRKFDIRLKKASKIAFEIMDVLELWWKERSNSDDWPRIYIIPNGNQLEVSTEELRAEAVIILNILNIYSNIKGKLVEMD